MSRLMLLNFLRPAHLGDYHIRARFSRAHRIILYIIHLAFVELFPFHVHISIEKKHDYPVKYTMLASLLISRLRDLSTARTCYELRFWSSDEYSELQVYLSICYMYTRRLLGS